MRSIAIKFAAILFFVQFAFGQTQINIDTQTKGSREPYWSVDSGSANSYSIAPTASVTVLQTGSCFVWKVTHANTGASTLTVSGFSSHNIVKNGSTALVSGDLPLNSVAHTCYDGTQYQLLNPGVAVAGGSASNTCSDGLNGTCIFRPNDTSTGTCLGCPTKYRASGTNDAHVIKMTSADNSLGWFNTFLGICISNCGTSGLAEIKIEGTVVCGFEPANTPTKGDLVDIGSTGKCFDNNTAGVNEDPEVHTFIGVTRVTGSSGSSQQIDLNKLQAFAGMWGTYGNSHGSPAQVMVQTVGNLASVGPMFLEDTNPGGTAFPATSVLPVWGTFALRLHSLSFNTETFDIYGQENHGGSVGSDLVLDASNAEGYTGGSLRIACDADTACSSLNHAWSHYSPPYIANLTGSVSQIDAQADSYDFTLTGNTTLTLVYINPGHLTHYRVCEDSTGGWTFAFGTPVFLYYNDASGHNGTMTNVAGLTSTAANACTDFLLRAIRTPGPVYDCVAGSGCSGAGGTVTSITAGTGLTGGTITGSGTIALSTPVSVANGGTGASTLTNHGVVVGQGTSAVHITGTGSSGECLVSNGASSDPTFQSCTTGGTGISSATSNGAMYATGSTTGTSTGALTNGQILIGDTGNAPQAATLTQGSGITITNGAHSITIASSGGGTSAAYGYQQCEVNDISGSNFTSKSCSSTTNETVGDKLLAVCSVYTANTAATLTMSNTHGDTWTTDATLLSANSGFKMAVFHATAGSSGSDTFTCTISVTNAFWGMSVHNIQNMTGVDQTSTQSNGSSSFHTGAAVTTTHANELGCMLVTTGGAGSQHPSIINGLLEWSSQTAEYLGCMPMPVSGASYTMNSIGGTVNGQGIITFSIY